MGRPVFVLQHLHVVEGCDDVKLIGVYSSLSFAKEAVERLKEKPGFTDSPVIRDPLKDVREEGFYIDEYELDKDCWEEGFVAVS